MELKEYICRAYSSKHLLWVGIAKTTFGGAGDWSAKSGEDNNVIWVLLEKTMQASRRSSHLSKTSCKRQ